MTTTTQTLLANVVYGQASGNYDGSSQDWYSNAVPAANYYAGNGSIQTIHIKLTGFQGIINLVASLGDDPEQAAWFPLAEFDYSSSPSTVEIAPSYTGNFVWVRAEVTDFTAGTIDRITINY